MPRILMQCRQLTGIDLPQKALAWENENGQVGLSYNDPNYLVSRHKITGCDDVIEKIERALAGIMQRAAGQSP